MKGFVKVTQQGGRVLSTFLFPLDASTGWEVGYIWLYTAFSIENELHSTVFWAPADCTWGFGVGGVGMSDCPLHFQLHSSTCQDDLTLHHYWPADASTRGVCLTVHCILNCIPQDVKMTLHSTTIDQQMSLLGGTSASQLHSVEYQVDLI